MYLRGYDALLSLTGKGSFSLDNIDKDSVTVVLIAEFEGGDGFTFAIRGKQEKNDWAAIAKNGQFTISGIQVTGYAADGNKEFKWKGSLFDDRLMLDVDINT